MPGIGPAAAPDAEPGLRADDETTLYGSLPADFWGDESGGDTAARVSDNAADRGGSAGSGATTGTALAELQALFPGRILEVHKHERRDESDDDSGLPAAAAAHEPPLEAEDDDGAHNGGYDDPNQSRLSFGPDD